MGSRRWSWPLRALVYEGKLRLTFLESLNVKLFTITESQFHGEQRASIFNRYTCL